MPDDNPDVGSCVGAVICLVMEPPDCPSGTLPGIKDGCYTGYCIPLDKCDALPQCDGLAETQCVERVDCTPLYEGVDCTCNGADCTCASWEFQSCEGQP